jgi:hypothetical protein
MYNVVYSTLYYYFMYVTQISHYIKCSVLPAVSPNCGRSWNMLPAARGALLCRLYDFSPEIHIYVVCIVNNVELLSP